MTHAELTTKVEALRDAISSTPALKEFATAWLAAEGTDKQEELTKQLGDIVKQNIALIDETIEFMDTDMAANILGKETANYMLQHAKEIKAQGAEFCDCPGCTAAKDIIDHLDEI